MKFLADENFPQKSVQILRKSVLDIKSIGVDDPGITDDGVLQLAIREKRTILTFDRDYGELIFKYGYKPTQGVIYFRIFSFAPEGPAELLLKILNINDIDFSQKLTVVEIDKIRQKKY